MNRFLVAALLAVGTLASCNQPVYAQRTNTPYNQPWYFAADYGAWAIQSQSPNTYIYSPVGLCLAVTPNGQFFPFTVGAPVYINDVTTSSSEIVTPTAITKTANSCGFSATVTNGHQSFRVQSGTAGLQEALNVLAVTTAPSPAVIYLDRNWYAGVASLPGRTVAGVIAAAKGNAKAYLVDLTTAPATYYTWNGTAYTAVLYSAH